MALLSSLVAKTAVVPALQLPSLDEADPGFAELSIKLGELNARERQLHARRDELRPQIVQGAGAPPTRDARLADLLGKWDTQAVSAATTGPLVEWQQVAAELDLIEQAREILIAEQRKRRFDAYKTICAAAREPYEERCQAVIEAAVALRRALQQLRAVVAAIEQQNASPASLNLLFTGELEQALAGMFADAKRTGRISADLAEWEGR